ncbi:IQ domain-containing protein E-like isoform X2 [Schistocerca nitens]|uniref:IQ domain-containing protein E-like isoform X2 n=1 Tax=Schistocerca nitens TaxID=7011 RepID=UPI0021181477|nr:IQ domain-containing protein E-like isoform X2 [Schistocerca nitens]
MKKHKYKHIVKQPKRLYEVSVEDLWDEISHLKSYVSNLKDENQKQKIQLLKMEKAVRTRDQQIEHLMNPINNSRIMQIISDKAVTLIMELTKRNKHLEKKIVERESFIQKLQKTNNTAVQNVHVSRAQKSLHHKEGTRSTSALSNLIATSRDLPTPSDIFLDVDSSGISCPVSCVKFSTCSPTSHASDASIMKETSLFRNDGDSQPGIAGEDIQNIGETIPVTEMTEKKSVHISTATGAENPDCSDFEIFDNFCYTSDPEETLDDSDVKRLIKSVRKLKKQRKIMLQLVADKNNEIQLLVSHIKTLEERKDRICELKMQRACERSRYTGDYGLTELLQNDETGKLPPDSRKEARKRRKIAPSAVKVPTAVAPVSDSHIGTGKIHKQPKEFHKQNIKICRWHFPSLHLIQKGHKL